MDIRLVTIETKQDEVYEVMVPILSSVGCELDCMRYWINHMHGMVPLDNAKTRFINIDCVKMITFEKVSDDGQ